MKINRSLLTTNSLATILFTMKEFENKFVHMINLYNRLENIDIEFVPGIPVTHLEAHLLALMYKNPYKKASELADMFGVTKGAISQHIKKLEKRELIKRIRKNDNFREVYIELTDNGITAVKTHEKFHEILFSKFAGVLNSMDDNSQKFVNNILDTIINLFNNAEKVIKEEF